MISQITYKLIDIYVGSSIEIDGQTEQTKKHVTPFGLNVFLPIFSHHICSQKITFHLPLFRLNIVKQVPAAIRND